MYLPPDSWVGIGGIGMKNGTFLAVVVIFIGGAGFWLASGNNSNNNSNPEKEGATLWKKRI
jgi:hypothetical protein